MPKSCRPWRPIVNCDRSASRFDTLHDTVRDNLAEVRAILEPIREQLTDAMRRRADDWLARLALDEKDAEPMAGEVTPAERARGRAGHGRRAPERSDWWEAA